MMIIIPSKRNRWSLQEFYPHCANRRKMSQDASYVEYA